MQELEIVQNIRWIPLLIILPAFIGILYFNLLFVSQRLQSDARIVAYIQLFHENELFNQWIGWETSLRFYRNSIDFNPSVEIKDILNKGRTEKRESQTGFYPLIFWFHLLFMTLIFLVWIYVVYTFGISISHEYLLLVILTFIIFILETSLKFYISSIDFNPSVEIKDILNKGRTEKRESQTGFYPLIFWFHLLFMILIFLVWIYVVYTFGISISHGYLLLIIFIFIIFILKTSLKFYIRSIGFNPSAEVEDTMNKRRAEKRESQTGFYPLIFWFHLLFMTFIFLVWIYVLHTFGIGISHGYSLLVILFIVILYILIIAYLLLLNKCFERLPHSEFKNLLENERDKWFYVHKENRDNWKAARMTRETQKLK